MRGAVHMHITTIGLDIAKNVFQVHGMDAAEKVVEINLLAPSKRRGGDWQRGCNGARCRGVEKFGLKDERCEIKANARHSHLRRPISTNRPRLIAHEFFHRY